MTTSKDAALDLLQQSPERLERGLVVLDRGLPLDEQFQLDLLLRDALGYPVVLLFTEGHVTAELGRVAGTVGALTRTRHLLGRMFAERGLDATLRPRFMLLAPRFPDDAAGQLELLASVEVVAMEYRVVNDADGRPVLDLSLFHRTPGPVMVTRSLGASELAGSVGALGAVTSGRPAPRGGETSAASAPHPVARPRPSGAASQTAASASASAAAAAAAAAPTAPPPIPAAAPAPAARAPSLPTASSPRAASTPAASPASAPSALLRPEPPVAPDLARALYLRARESIRSLASQITENTEDGRVRFRADDQLLASLRLDQDGFRMAVGDAPGDGALVTSDALLDERLNELFVLYFSRMGPEIPVD
jgi:hypothetical protein